MNDIAIIGGGVTGMALAYALARRGQPVTVFEREEETGGLAATLELGPLRIDRYYHHLFPAHREILEVIGELGLQERLAFRKGNMASYSQGRLFPLNSALDLLRFKPLPLFDRLRVGLGASAFLLRKGWQEFDGLSAASLLKRNCGERGYALFWEPLLKNKFGAHASDVAATWLWDRLQSRSGGRVGRSSAALGYLRGGFRPLFAGLETEVARCGGRIATGRPVNEIAPAGKEGGPFVLNGNGADPYRSCIVTLPLPQFMELAPTLPEEYRQRLAGIAYSHSVCMELRLRAPLSPYYWINVGDGRIPFAVVVEHTNWLGGDDHPGEHIVYLSRYCDRFDDPAWTATAGDLLDVYCSHLKKMFPGFREADVLAQQVRRDRHTQPIFRPGYAKSLPPFTTPLKDLFLVNTSQFYPRSRCMNTSFVLAQEFLSRWLDREARR